MVSSLSISEFAPAQLEIEGGIPPVGNELDITEFDWPMFQYDLNNTGYSPSSVPTYPSVVWASELDGDVLSTPAVAYGMVYVPAERVSTHNIFSLDENTGDLVWSNITSHYIDSTPAVAGGKVVAGSADGVVHAWNASDGSVEWTFDKAQRPTFHLHIHA
ncbi:MAG: PQQ-binding-like beta-propeller repeat protein, partial [Thermoplasmata archaeon]|nr:PQQ-binding-like beta-propeller repeat protein [Thermoplasmata archaeon]